MGDGGALVIKEPELYEKAKKLRWLGIDKDTYKRSVDGDPIHKKYLWKYDVPYIGYKYHMNDITAAIGVEQLKYLDKHNARRLRIMEMYKKAFSSSRKITLPSYETKRISSYHFYPIFVERREDLIAELKSNDIHPGVHYFRNDHYSPYMQANLPNTDYVTNHEITLPIHLGLTDEDVESVISCVLGEW